jgi:hypothetical protein
MAGLCGRTRYQFYLVCKQEPGSSVSIVSGYGLDGRGPIPDRGRGFFL